MHMDAQLFQRYLFKDHSFSIKFHWLLLSKVSQQGLFLFPQFYSIRLCVCSSPVLSCLLWLYNLGTLYFKVPVFSSSKSDFVVLQYCIGYYETFALPYKLYKHFVSIYKLLTMTLNMIPVNL